MNNCTSPDLVVLGEMPSSTNENLDFAYDGIVCFGGNCVPPSVWQYFLDLFRSGVGSKQNFGVNAD